MVNFVNKFESDFSSKIGGYYVGFDLTGRTPDKNRGLITFNVSFKNFQLIRKGSFIEDKDLCELKILGNWNGAGDYLAGSALIRNFFKTDIDSRGENFYFSFDYKHIDLFIEKQFDFIVF